MKKPTKKRRGYLPKRPPQRGGDPFYNSYDWRSFRKKHKVAQRSRDQLKSRMLYKEDNKIPLEDYNAFLDSGNPLCAHCFEQGKIKPGNTLDHITPRRLGGSDYADSNLQWLCEPHHAIKSQSERGK